MQGDIKTVYKMMLTDDPLQSVTASNKEYFDAINLIRRSLALEEPCRATLWASNNDRNDNAKALKVPHKLISVLFTQPLSDELKWLDDVLKTRTENV